MVTDTANTAGTDFVIDADFGARLKIFLAENPRERFALEHEDLGYGFGAWSTGFLRALGAAGLIGLMLPRDLGGAGAGPREMYQLLTALADARVPAEALIYSEAVASCIAEHGSAELQARILPSILDGSATFCEALSEPDAGSDLFALRTTATRDGDTFVVNGQKIWTSNGWLANLALVAVRTDRNAPTHRGVSVLLVDLQSPGILRRPIRDASLQPSFSEIFFDDVRVPAGNLVGPLNGGLAPVLEMLHWDRLWARCVKPSFLRRELSDLLNGARTADSGSGDPSVNAHFGHVVGQLGAEIDVCEAMFQQAVDAEVTGDRDTELIAAAKLFADRLGHEFYRRTLSLVGPGSARQGDPAAHWARAYLNSHGLLLAGGTAEMQKIGIARRRLGLGARQTSA